MSSKTSDDVGQFVREAGVKIVDLKFTDPPGVWQHFSTAQLMAGLDGIRNRIDPGNPIDKDLYELEPAEAAHVKEHARFTGGGARRIGEGL